MFSWRDLSLLPFCGLSWGPTGNGSGRLSARGHGENPGYAGFCGVPDIPSNPHHSPVLPVDGPNTTNARSSRAFMVCVCAMSVLCVTRLLLMTFPAITIFPAIEKSPPMAPCAEIPMLSKKAHGCQKPNALCTCGFDVRSRPGFARAARITGAPAGFRSAIYLTKKAARARPLN